MDCDNVFNNLHDTYLIKGRAVWRYSGTIHILSILRAKEKNEKKKPKKN